MGSAIHVTYVGFQARSRVREYTFLVKDGGSDAREFRLTIANDAFLAHRARYQDAPDICCHRLQHELASSANNPLKAHFTISDMELEEYRVAHSPKPSPRRGYQPRREGTNFK